MKPGDQVWGRLLEAGLSDSETASKAKLLDRAGRALEALGARPSAGARRFFVPGRIEVLGKHTDYAGGRSLLCAAERGICVIASPRADNRVHVVDAGDGSRTELALAADPPATASGWTVYPAAVVRRISTNFPRARTGADIAFASDLPRAAGLSSSSALVVALFTALADVNGIASEAAFRSAVPGRPQLADYLGCVENGRTFGKLEGDPGVGAATGSQDQTAILCARRSALVESRFCPVRIERAVILPAAWSFVVAVSGISSDKTGGARDRYNRLSGAARAVLECWQAATGRADESLFAAATSDPEAPSQMREILDASSRTDFRREVLRDRFDQFYSESAEIIPQAVEALARLQEKTLGLLVDRSQALAEQLLQNQTPQTVGLARSARALGAIAASAFGGGFGGSVWALVRTDDVPAFRKRWAQAYAGAFPEGASGAMFFPTRPGPPLLRLDDDAGTSSISDLT